MADKYSEGNLSVNVDGNNQNRSALLGEQSPNNRLHDMSGIEGNNLGNLDNQSLGGSAYAPPQKYYKTEGQAKLDHFQERLKQEAGGEAHQRNSKSAAAVDDSENSDEEMQNKNQNVDQSFVEKMGFKHNAPLDATGCSQIQNLEDYVTEVTNEQKNPKQQFFDLSRNYYTAKYDKDNKKEITVKSYIITEDHQNFIKDLSMDILQTNQGCLPIIKTFEWNAYSKHKFVKALKFYNYRTDCKLSKQFVVDDGVMHDNFHNYDVSLLHFGNTILFYKREENWHKLMMYDVLTKQENELEGYQIAEPVGDEALRYHIMFSQEFGSNQKSKLEKGQVKSVHDFLKTKFVFAQTYRVQEGSDGGGAQRYNYQNKSLAMWSMEDTQTQLIQYQYVQKQGQEDPTYKQFGFNMTEEAVQWVGHIQDPENKRIIFVAADPFQTHKFEYRPFLRFNQSGSIEFSDLSTYLGNNELQNMNRQLVTNQNGEVKKRMEQDVYEKQTEIQSYCQAHNLPIPVQGTVIKDKNLEQLMTELNQVASLTEKKWKMNNLSPFLIHQNPQFLIQKENIIIEDMYEGKKKVEQYFYITHDNQFMLISPNYEDQKEKTKIILEVARKYRQHQMTDDDVDFDILTDEEKLKLYNDDFVGRQKEFRQATHKKISHVCNDPNRSMNHMKRSEHLKMILDYPRDLNLYDKIILSTDQEQSNIYVYQSSKVTGENKIQIFSFANNIAQSQKMRSLPKQLLNIIKDEEKVLNKKPSSKRFQADNRCYYLNSKYKNLIASNTHIKTVFDDAQDKAELVRPEYDNELKQEVVDYRSNQMTHRISHADEQRFAVVEGKSGKYLNIRIKQDHNNESITFQMYTRNNTNYCFCFTINTMSGMKKTYFFVKKTIREIEDLGSDNHQSLITFQDDQQVTVVLSNDLKGTKKEVLAKYTQKMTFKQLQDKINESDNVVDQVEKKESPSKKKVSQAGQGAADCKISSFHLNLQFEMLYDMSSSIDFLPFIYQDSQKIESHNLLVLDIDKMDIVQKTCINANLTLRKTIRKTECGFSLYTLTRTSDVFNQKQGFFTSHTGGGDASYQIVKYQVGSQYFIANPEEKNPASCTLEFSEYCVKFSNYEKNQIQLIGRKQLLLSDFAIKARSTSFDKFLIVPWFDNSNLIKGSQFLLKEDDTSITLKDQDENNIYHQKSEMVAFGHQKFLVNQDNHDEYILIISCQFKQKVYMQGNFENNEAYYIMNKIQRKLLSQQLAKFEYFVLNDDFDQLMREEFYQPQEVLQGKSIFDLCLGFPKEIANGLKQAQEVYKRIDGSLISEICNYDDKILKFYLDAKLCEENLMVQIDFNFVSSLRLAMELNSNQSVKLMLNNVFKLNSIEYQEMMMLDFPKFLDQNNIKRIYPFLERDYEEYLTTQKDQDEVYTVKNKKRNQFCNFEEFLSHPKLPPFGTEQKAFHVKQNFHDFHNAEQEIVQEMIDKDPYMTWGVKNFGNEVGKETKTESQVFVHKNVEVEHSLIDFQKIIIGEKIRDVQEGGFLNVNFNDQHLASIFCVEPDHQVDFYNLETVRKIVDFQFITTKWFLQLMFKFYFFGFMLPFIVSLSTESSFILNVSYTMCLFTQIFFFMFELVQLKEQRLAYFTDVYNLVDTSQFAIFVLLYITKMLTQFSSDSLTEILMQAILLYQCFYKVFYFIRIYDSMAFILTLLVNICYEAIPFGLFILGVLLGFVKIYALFHVGYDKNMIQPGLINDAGEQVEQDQIAFDLIKRAMIVYMNTAGEITAPILEDNMWERAKESNFMLFIIFGFVIFLWISQQMLFGVAGTFFISMVFQSYEKQYRLFPMYHYKIKARYNEENFQIMDMFRSQRNFKVIFFSFDKEFKSTEETQWLGITNAIQKFQIDQQNKKIQQDKQSNEKRDQIAKLQVGTSKNVDESLKLVRHLAMENQELKGRVAELSRNLGYEQK